MTDAFNVLLHSATAERLLQSNPEYNGWLKKKNNYGKCMLF